MEQSPNVVSSKTNNGEGYESSCGDYNTKNQEYPEGAFGVAVPKVSSCGHVCGCIGRIPNRSLLKGPRSETHSVRWLNWKSKRSRIRVKQVFTERKRSSLG